MSERSGAQGAMALLEDAIHLLRQAPLTTLLCHGVGTVPFALVLLRYSGDVTNPRTSDSTCAAEALVLALLLAWMNCWRAVFAGRLRRQLSGAPDTPWTGRRIWRLASGQAFFGASKLPVMSLAMLVMFPLAGTVAFYRYTAVLADREDLDPLQVMARARQLAGRQPGQGWTILPLLTFLWLLAVLNIALFLGLLPQLVRMLTGYDSAFSRSGIYWVENPLFALLAIAVSWIAFDPFVQAVYCVRCFRAESMETGEDLRAALRGAGLRATAQRISAALLGALLFLAAAAHTYAAVRPEELEKSVHETMLSHEYDWRLPPAPSAPTHNSWLVKMADHMIAGIKAATAAIARAIKSFMKWLFGEQPAPPVPGAPPTAGLHGSVYALMGVVILLAAWIVWRKRQSLHRPATASSVSMEAIRLDAEDLTPDRLPEQSWLDLAEQCLREGDLRLALRAFYLANLAWLGRAEFIRIHPGKTNREYQVELRRRTRGLGSQSGADVRGLFEENVASFERAWYGMHEVSGEEIALFRGRMSQMKETLAPTQGAAA